MQMLYPTARRYPFDEVCSRIVGLLELHRWKVPGVEVVRQTSDHGSYVSVIHYGGCVLHFGRMQTSVNDPAAVESIDLPGKKLEVFSGDSAIRLWLKEEADGQVIYDGCWQAPGAKRQHYRGGGIPPYLARRRLSRDDSGASHFETARVLQEFAKHLRDNLLRHILEQPLSVFCFGTETDAERITGLQRPQTDHDSTLVAFEPGGYRPVGKRPAEEDRTIPDAAHRHMRWCGLGTPDARTPLKQLEIPYVYRDSKRDTYLFAIRPNHLSDIYIADHEPYAVLQAELEQLRDRLTDADLARMEHARARTIVPIADYLGGFKRPVVLVGRNLAPSEVQLISGPWPVCSVFEAILDEARTNATFGEQLQEYFAAYREYEERGGGRRQRRQRIALDEVTAHLRQEPHLGELLRGLAAELYKGRRDRLRDASDGAILELYAVQSFGLYRL